MRQKYFDGKSWYSPPPSYPSTFFIPETFWYTEGFLYEIIRYCETKQFWQKIVIPAPSLIPHIFRYQKFSETLKGTVTKFLALWDRKFSALWDKKFSTENLDTLPTPPPPPPLLSVNFFATGNFLKYSTEGSPTKFFGTVRQNFFNGKSWYPFA